ncbi:MAG TPA: LuxR C-terminal-related transcriptional regulator [Acidimicrobiales bacterium]
MRRDRLVAQLDLAVQRRVAVVVAPPGYGKTVAVAQWARAHPRARVRWLTLRPEHDEGSRLAAELCAVLGAPSPDPAGAATLGRLDGDRRQARPVILASVRAALKRAPPATLVLDDFHRLAAPEVVGELCDLIEHLPRWIHAVLVTRVDPPLRYHRLRLDDELVEVRQDDLAFRWGEAAELLHRLAGRDLSDGEVDALVARTEGWATGLQLAGVSLRGRRDPGRFVATISADDRHVADYLTEEVLRQQPGGVRRFLLSTCVLDRMCGPLCDAVTGEAGGQAMLEELDRRSLFVTPLDPGRQWFRYHTLFRALLRSHLRDEDPALERRLLERAAAWHLSRGELDAGVDHLADAGAWKDLLDVASAYGCGLLARGRPTTIARWVERVPAAVRERNVEATLLHAAASLMAGDTSAVDRDLAVVGSGARTAHRATASLLRAHSAAHQGRTARAAGLAGQALREVADLDDAEIPNPLGLLGSRRDVEAAAQLAWGVASLHRGNLTASRAALDVALDGGHAVWQVEALGCLALLEAWSGRLDAAKELAARSLSFAGELGVGRQPLAAEAYLALAIVARHRDEVGRAAALLDQAAGRAVPAGHPVLATLVLGEQALVTLRSGRPADGLAALRRLAPTAGSDACDADGRRRAAEARVRLAIGDTGGAERVLGRGPDDRVDVASARMRLAIERGDAAACRALAGHWPSGPEPRASLERDLWVAVLDHREGDQAAAREGFASVVRRAEPEWNVGPFRSAGRHVLGPGRQLYRSAPSPFLRVVVDGEPTIAASRPPGRGRLVEPLTERESMLLALLPTRLSNAEIADRLGVSVNTVKTHAKHVYRKLAVTGRGEAVAAAERIRLI